MSNKTTSRVGLYIQSDTRDRLNALKDELDRLNISHVSQDDALNYLLDLADKKHTPSSSDQLPSGQIGGLETVGDRIRALREKAGWTQGELATRVKQYGVDVTQAYLSHVERTEQVPGGDKIAGLARVFGVSADYLLLLTDDPTPRG